MGQCLILAVRCSGLRSERYGYESDLRAFSVLRGESNPVAGVARNHIFLSSKPMSASSASSETLACHERL